MSEFTKIRINFTRRPVPKNGIFSSDNFNATLEELSADLINFSNRWNNELYPLLASLPNGTETDALDGANLYVDNDATETSDEGLFYEETEPKTIKEALLDFDTRITDLVLNNSRHVRVLHEFVTGVAETTHTWDHDQNCQYPMVQLIKRDTTDTLVQDATVVFTDVNTVDFGNLTASTSYTVVGLFYSNVE